MEKLVKKKVEIYVYMIMVTVTCVFLSYSEWMYKYIYTLKAVKLLKGCLNSFLILSIIVCSLRVCWERCDQRIIEKIFNFIWKAILIIILWKIMLLYFCIYCIYNGLENKNLVKPYKNLIIYTVVNGVELTVFWITIFFVCRREYKKSKRKSETSSWIFNLKSLEGNNACRFSIGFFKRAEFRNDSIRNRCKK